MDDNFPMLHIPSPKEVREIRLVLGLSQNDFAWMLHVDNATVTRWESGASEMSPIFYDWLKIKLAEKGKRKEPS